MVVVMQPMTPGFIDARSREELEAAVASADAAVRQAEADIRKLQAILNFARTELQRAQALAHTQAISTQAFDKAKFEVETSEAALISAKAQLEVRQFARVSLAARLIDPTSVSPPTNPACCVQIRAPVTGRILKIVQDSEAVVQAGTPLIDIGDPADLEVVTDLLSTDAVQIRVDAPVRIDGWGGAPMQGRVDSRRSGGLRQGLCTRDRGATRSHHHRFHRTAGGLVAAWARLPGHRACHRVERRRRPECAGGRTVPPGRGLGRIPTEGWSRQHDHRQGWSPKWPGSRGDVGPFGWRSSHSAPER